ncbi:hypothetical protein [Asanoa hainanensis]|uniref:hypothetical protein n=1 Tax=Asanoa hainanensis TaxID=560556 RepID=UPI00117D7B7D|nr:hypothetical protein [Asanoa hainanensis]
MRGQDLRLLDHHAVARHRPAAVFRTGPPVAELVERRQLAVRLGRRGQRRVVDVVVAGVEATRQQVAGEPGGVGERGREPAHEDVGRELRHPRERFAGRPAERGELDDQRVGQQRGGEPLQRQLAEPAQGLPRVVALVVADRPVRAQRGHPGQLEQPHLVLEVEQQQRAAAPERPVGRGGQRPQRGIGVAARADGAADLRHQLCEHLGTREDARRHELGHGARGRPPDDPPDRLGDRRAGRHPVRGRLAGRDRRTDRVDVVDPARRVVRVEPGPHDPAQLVMRRQARVPGLSGPQRRVPGRAGAPTLRQHRRDRLVDQTAPHREHPVAVEQRARPLDPAGRDRVVAGRQPELEQFVGERVPDRQGLPHGRDARVLQPGRQRRARRAGRLSPRHGRIPQGRGGGGNGCEVEPVRVRTDLVEHRERAGAVSRPQQPGHGQQGGLLGEVHAVGAAVQQRAQLRLAGLAEVPGEQRGPGRRYTGPCGQRGLVRRQRAAGRRRAGGEAAVARWHRADRA